MRELGRTQGKLYHPPSDGFQSFLRMLYGKGLPILVLKIVFQPVFGILKDTSDPPLLLRFEFNGKYVLPTHDLYH
jgi:hypothetical protein